jgi:SDR family mycofactocin-dependent oxidoreductase
MPGLGVRPSVRRAEGSFVEQLAGQVALVTGGARGQGRAHAVALAAAGATVVVCDIAAPLATVPYPLATPGDLDETVRIIGDAGGRASAATADVRDSAAVTELTDRIVAEHGRLDILIANAGICVLGPVADLPDDVWHDTIETNLSGVFYCIRAALPHMTRHRYGRIVAISSGAGRGGMRNLGHYGASKWGLIGLVKTVALETATDGITANVICPATVATPMVLNDYSFRAFRPDLPHPTADDVMQRHQRLSPMRMAWLEPEDVTRAVMYLVTDRGTTTGSVLEVNLGTSASRT